MYFVQLRIARREESEGEEEQFEESESERYWEESESETESEREEREEEGWWGRSMSSGRRFPRRQWRGAARQRGNLLAVPGPWESLLEVSTQEGTCHLPLLPA